jgi:hypothetical protein
MKNFFFPALFLLAAVGLRAQMGVSAAHLWFNASDWREHVEMRVGANDPNLLFRTGYQVSVDYWIRLPDVRIEFFPELRYASLSASPQTTFDNAKMNWQSLSLHATTNVYLLDFFGDCDCPTFSKQDPFFKKGFFLQVSPGAHYLMQSYRSGPALGLELDQNDWAFSFGLGAGIDIGLSDWITLTPYGRITRLFGAQWTGFDYLPYLGNEVFGVLSQPNTIWLPEAGMRLGLRWKH